MKRLNWTEEQLRQCLYEKYGQRNLDPATHQQFLELWQYLQSIESSKIASFNKENLCRIDKILRVENEMPFLKSFLISY